MKKGLLMFIFPIFALSSITACKGTHSLKHSEFKKSSDLSYLFEVTYNDYDWNDVTNWLESDTPNNESGGFGCSSVHNKNFYGRSFDFCFTDMCEFLVRTNHENGHFASVGVSIADCNVNEEKANRINSGNGDEKDKLNEKMIPFCLVDGINENGVVCNTNVVPAKDLPAHDGEESYFTHGTNPGKENLFYQFMPRFILDNAKSAKHAVELLMDRNITAMNSKGKQRDYFGISKMGYELHCMIADKNDTYIIEIVEDRMSVIAGDIMTNFYYSNISPSGAGFERHHTLWDNYASGDTLDGMKELIQEVQYSPCYNPKWDGEDTKYPKWATEFAGVGVDIIPKEIIKGGITYKLTFYNAEWFCTTFWDDIKQSLQNAYDTTQDQSKRATSTGPSVPWISTHVEVFDIENLTLHLCTQENYKTWIMYKI